MQPEVLLLLKLLELLLLLLKLLLLLLKNRDKKGQPNKQLQSSADRTEQLMYSSSDRKGQLDKQLHSSADKTEQLPEQEQRLYTILAGNSLITLKKKSFSIASCICCKLFAAICTYKIHAALLPYNLTAFGAGNHPPEC